MASAEEVTVERHPSMLMTKATLTPARLGRAWAVVPAACAAWAQGGNSACPNPRAALLELIRHCTVCSGTSPDDGSHLSTAPVAGSGDR